MFCIVLMSFQVQAITVLSSIKPIHFLVQELTDGVADSSYLVPNGASPHDYALRPSDIKMLRRADIVVWYGDDLEAFLSRVLSEHKNVITLGSFSSVAFYHYEHPDTEENLGYNEGNQYQEHHSLSLLLQLDLHCLYY